MSALYDPADSEPSADTPNVTADNGDNDATQDAAAETVTVTARVGCCGLTAGQTATISRTDEVDACINNGLLTVSE
jgi:NADPH-dependent curcumin reductase CurA